MFRKYHIVSPVCIHPPLAQTAVPMWQCKLEVMHQNRWIQRTTCCHLVLVVCSFSFSSVIMHSQLVWVKVTFIFFREGEHPLLKHVTRCTKRAERDIFKNDSSWNTKDVHFAVILQFEWIQETLKTKHNIYFSIRGLFVCVCLCVCELEVHDRMSQTGLLSLLKCFLPGTCGIFKWRLWAKGVFTSSSLACHCTPGRSRYRPQWELQPKWWTL